MAAINHPLGRARRIPGAHAGAGARNPVRRVNWWVLGSLALLGASASLPVIQNSTATTRGYELQLLLAERARLEGEISVLEADIAQLTSLGRVQQRALELGLGPASSPIYISVDEAGPEPAKLPAEYLPGPIPSGEKPDSWWRSLFQWLPLLPD